MNRLAVSTAIVIVNLKVVTQSLNLEILKIVKVQQSLTKFKRLENIETMLG
jgi:hypothetical protein